MFSGWKYEAARREKSLAVDWHDCSWVPAIIVQAPPLIADRLERGVHAASRFESSPTIVPSRFPRSLKRPEGRAPGPVRRFNSIRRQTKPLLHSSPVLHTVCHNLNILNAMKTASPSPHRLRAGFTLVELLVVIAIIGILAAMSLAVIPRVMDSGRKAKAKLEAQDIVTAIEHYDSVYGRFPVSALTQTAAGAGDFTFGGSLIAGIVPPLSSVYTTNNSEVIAILMNLTNYPNASGATANLNYQKNPQKTIFLNAKRTDDNTLPGVGTDLVYRDPWGNPYIITMDLNYDEQSEDAFYALQKVSQTPANSQSGFNGLVNSTDPSGNGNHFRFHGKVMVWSAGVDKKIDPLLPANQGVNKDNVTSW